MYEYISYKNKTFRPFTDITMPAKLRAKYWQVIKGSGLPLPESRFLITEILLRF